MFMEEMNIIALEILFGYLSFMKQKLIYSAVHKYDNIKRKHGI